MGERKRTPRKRLACKTSAGWRKALLLILGKDQCLQVVLASDLDESDDLQLLSYVDRG